jgi:xylulose-5-phosphate/fructose-6-phosphate phosphoketolase
MVEKGLRMPKAIAETPLTQKELQLIDAYSRAANYLSVGQIYLLDNPLLKEPLSLQHINPRLPGDGGTTPALNFIYVHLNRVRQVALNDGITHRMPA